MSGKTVNPRYPLELLVPELCLGDGETVICAPVLLRQMKTSAARTEHSPPLFLTEKQLAARWQLTPKTIQRMVHRGELPFIVVSRSPRFPLTEVERYEASSASPPIVLDRQAATTMSSAQLDIPPLQPLRE